MRPINRHLSIEARPSVAPILLVSPDPHFAHSAAIKAFNFKEYPVSRHCPREIPRQSSHLQLLVGTVLRIVWPDGSPPKHEDYSRGRFRTQLRSLRNLHIQLLPALTIPFAQIVACR